MMKVPLLVIIGKSPMNTVCDLISPVSPFMNSAVTNNGAEYVMSLSRHSASVKDGRSDVPQTAGLEEIFEEISPIEDFGGSMSLSFREHRFEPPKYTAEECKEKDFTFSQPLFVTAEFVNYTTGEIKSQTVFMGDFPMMTEKGTFIINGTERVVVSQLDRKSVV